MASYKKFVLTDKGKLLLNKVIAGECDLVVTKAATGDGKPEEGDDLKKWTALKSQRQVFGISSFSRMEDNICIRFVISNYNPESGSGLTEEYRVQEIGVYAEDPEEGEILYAVSTADAGKGDFIPAYDETSPVTVTVNAYLVVGTGGNVLIRVSPDVYATAADVAELRQRTVDVEDKIGDLKTVAFTGSYNDLKNKPTIPAAVRVKGNAESTYRTGDVNITPANIGLGNVNNTSDANKPVSTAQQTAINAAYANANQYTNTKISELINGAPETLDTLKEVADAIAEHKSVTDALDAAIGRKANQSELDSHTGNSTVHITASERSAWNDKQTKTGDASNNTVTFSQASTRTNISSGEKLSVLFGKIAKWFADLKTVAFTGSYSDLSGKPTIPSKTSDLTNNSGFLTGTEIKAGYGVVKNGKKSNQGTGGWVQNDITFGVAYKDFPLVSIQQMNPSIDSSVYLDKFFVDETAGYTGFRYWVYCPNSSWAYKTWWFAVGNIK